MATQTSNPRITRDNLFLLRWVPPLRDEEEQAEKTLYRYWWECLLESAEYAAALRGELGEPYASMAREFGDLREHFALWWVSTGRLSFAGQAMQPSVAEMEVLRKSKNREMMLVWDDRARPNLYLRVPLTLDRREIMRQVDAMVASQQAKRADEIEAARNPRRGFYPDQRIRRDTIETLLEVWRARKGTEEAWWQTGERLGHWPQFTPTPEDDPAEAKRKRRLMTLTLQRLHKMAAKLIDYAARGDFPRLK